MIVIPFFGLISDLTASGSYGMCLFVRTYLPQFKLKENMLPASVRLLLSWAALNAHFFHFFVCLCCAGFCQRHPTDLGVKLLVLLPVKKRHPSIFEPLVSPELQ